MGMLQPPTPLSLMANVLSEDVVVEAGNESDTEVVSAARTKYKQRLIAQNFSCVVIAVRYQLSLEAMKQASESYCKDCMVVTAS